MNWIKTSFQVLIISLSLLLIIETILLYVFSYRSVTLGDVNCKHYISDYDYSEYKPNCELYFKHWEQYDLIDYSFNSFGRRDGNPHTGKQLIAFIGDSFTFGAMVDINQNYNYRSLYYFGRKDLAAHNYGVSGEQFHNIINKLRKYDFSRYKYIVYGLTPNDLFDLVDGSISKTNKEALVSDNNSNLFKYIKNILLNSATSKFLLHNLMSIDSVYYWTYMQRQPYAGYLEDPISINFKNAMKTVFDQLTSLDNSIKDKLVIILLPQPAEVAAMRLGHYSRDFMNVLVDSCQSSGLICFTSDIEALSKLDESHFPVDGHLNVSGNDIVGRQLGNDFNKLIWD